MGISSASLLIFTSGVLPMVPSIFSAYSMMFFKIWQNYETEKGIVNFMTFTLGIRPSDYSNRMAFTGDIFEMI